MSKLLGQIKKNKSKEEQAKATTYRGRKNLLTSNGSTFKSLINSNIIPRYDDKKLITDACYALYSDAALSREAALTLLGLSQEELTSKFKNIISQIDDLAKASPEKALTLSRQYFGKKNPLLNVLHILNESRTPIAELNLKRSFGLSDYAYSKNIGLLKRNLTLSSNGSRELFQAEFKINTDDLKLLDGKILYLCPDCLKQNFVSQDSVLNPITCECGSVVHPSRGLMGWDGIDGVVFKFGVKQVHSNSNGKITKRDTDEYITSQVRLLSKDERIKFSSLMLRHHNSIRKSECLCAQCLLEG